MSRKNNFVLLEGPAGDFIYGTRDAEADNEPGGRKLRDHAIRDKIKAHYTKQRSTS